VYPLSSCREFWVFRDPPLSLGLSWRDRAALGGCQPKVILLFSAVEDIYGVLKREDRK